MNIGAHLANRLTEQFEKFQVFQKMFNSILYERLKTTGKKSVINEASDDNKSNITSEMCLVLDEEQETMLQERSQEIDQVITDTLHINDILNQIQVMTVQQGSLFDRIDVNLDRTRHNLSKTVQRLEKTAESFSVHQKRLILFFITLAIFVTFLLILHK
jgi:t-SNARE complex subunit (syntaxin)